jgi:hypothetical protein
VDDTSRKPIPYFLKLKFDTERIIKTFIEEVNNNHFIEEKRVQQFHSNGGREFLSKKLEQFFIKQGISRLGQHSIHLNIIV